MESLAGVPTLRAGIRTLAGFLGDLLSALTQKLLGRMASPVGPELRCSSWGVGLQSLHLLRVGDHKGPCPNQEAFLSQVACSRTGVDKMHTTYKL